MRNARLLLVATLLLAGSFAGAAQGTETLGQTLTDGARVDGVLMPSGGTLLSPSTVSTADLPAIVNLANGQVLTLGLNSQASFESLANGDVRVAVEAGTLAFQNPAGGVMQIAANQVVYASQEGIGTGAQVGTEQEETVRLCELQNTDAEERATCRATPKKNVCDWSPIDVPASEVPAHLELGDNTPDALDLPQDCHRNVVWPWFAALAPMAQLSAATAVVAGGVVAAETFSSDDEIPATVTQP